MSYRRLIREAPAIGAYRCPAMINWFSLELGAVQLLRSPEREDGVFAYRDYHTFSGGFLNFSKKIIILPAGR